jgi:hypothetical protein
MGFEIEESDTYKDADTLRELYCKKKMSDSEIADLFDVTRGTITYWRDKHGIDGWSPEEYASHRPASLRTTTLGYEAWDASTNNETIVCYVHRLLAVAEGGLGAIDKDTEIHHKNGVPWDNRPENIETLNTSDHRRVHANERRNSKTGRFEE